MSPLFVLEIKGNKMASIRIQRLEKELIKLFNIVLTNKIRDKKLSWVSITGVRVTPDMQYAKVYFSFLEAGASQHTIQKILTKSSGFFKKEIAAAHIMRTIPDISFFYDETEESARRIDQLLNQISKEKNSDDIEDEKTEIEEEMVQQEEENDEN